MHIKVPFVCAAMCAFHTIAAAAGLTLTPSSGLSFNSTNVGQQSAPQAIVVTNTSVTPIAVAISIVEDAPIPYEIGTQFAQTNNCGTILAAGASCQVSVTYTPTHTGSTSATLQFGSTNPSVSLIGFAYALDNSNIFVTIDAPSSGAAVSGVIQAYGWAIANHEGIDSVLYSIDDPSHIFSNGGYGANRPDVCAVHAGVWGCPYVGWSFSLDTTVLTNGSHTLYIKATGLSSHVNRILSVPFVVNNLIAAAPIEMHVEQPAAGGVLTGRVGLQGWAISLSGASPAPRVQISVDGTPVWLTNWSSRPDVCAAYPNRPGCPNVGWSYELDTTLLADGPHLLTFQAQDTPKLVTSYPIVTVPVTVANFAASQNNPLKIRIDSPTAQSGPLSGMATVSGWATAGSNDTIRYASIYVDGRFIGPAVYGSPRPDVCIVYPQEQGCANSGWSYSLDTTLLADGPHQLQMTVTSSSGIVGTVQTPFSISNAGISHPFHAHVDSPTAKDSVHGNWTVSGWAVSDNHAVAHVTISVDGIPDGFTTPIYERPDVCVVYPSKPNCPNVGWVYTLNTLKFADGAHTLDITVTDGQQNATFTSAFTIANNGAAAYTLVYIDQPAAGSAALTGTATVLGWAVDDWKTPDLSMAVDGVVLEGAVTNGLSRPDVCNVYPGRYYCPYVGWSALLDTTSLTDGPHTLTVTAKGTMQQTASTKINVANGNITTPSYRIYMDQPIANSPSLRGDVVVSGWAIVASGAQPIVNVYIDDLPAGHASFSDIRQDVCNVYTSAQNCPNVGWSLRLDTTQWLDGPHTLKIVAYSTIYGAASVSRAITIDNFTFSNPMHLTIDNGSGGKLSGTATLFGWAVSDDAAITTVAISIDGAAAGNAIFGDARPDVCAVYQSRLGCPNVGWHLPVDTTTLTNGSHTVSVTATSSYGEQLTQTATVTVQN